MKPTPAEIDHLKERIRREGKQTEATYQRWLEEFRAKPADAHPPITKNCIECGKPFTAVWTEGAYYGGPGKPLVGGYNSLCSIKCTMALGD